jgi:Predicted acyl-CoA transferases/carnitine dehydratase
MSKFALEGIRVVELTTGAAGPTVARVLGEFGAEVIRCETACAATAIAAKTPSSGTRNPTS